MKFTELGLNDELLKAIKRSGFEEATPIQEQTIPLALAGKDVIGQAQTGTGKTAAFALPILQNLDKDKKVIQALIIEPTRELAIQTQEELFRLGRDEHARVQVVYGGADIGRQIRSLKNNVPAILVGTPGRLLDHLKRKTVNLEDVSTIVLDEADEMLDMGFIQDIESILSYVKNRKQTLLFSATMPKPILNISEKFMHDPEVVQVKAKELTADLIDQYYVRAKDSEKFDIMCRLFDVQNPDLAVIFVRTKRRVDEITRGLQARGYNAAGIHGDLSQARRISVLKRFRAGKLDILVATDVAARGLDISGVTHVYNYDIPQDPDSYVHRIGRTGRAGQNGNSITFVTPGEMSYMKTIERLTKKKMMPLTPPTDDQALHGQLKIAKTKIEDLMKEDLSKYTDDASELLENYSAVDLAAALLKNLSKDSADVEVNISSQKPLPSRGGNGRRGGGRSRGNYGHGGGRGRSGRGGYRGGERGHNDHGYSGYRGGDHGRSGGGYRGNNSHRSGGGHSFVIKNKKD
ncbi:DEAD/DEAH box helicase [Lactobacillus xylocopicola]|uniref:DEAD-box ATP-dependent RNA helicase CshA n=1 Tax=Lactobacillus xylocopicola TaxID=2976676 RepID=A0ABM8BI14_9LACO|nr:DEAD/DEAH box helicase [Lactobacillus xylocopicola]BDR60943.1 DEAD-box ATP-dependent RNA helicase CshA [Lactobacillus xylocopicola]